MTTKKTPHSITFYISKARKGFYDRALKALDGNVSRYLVALIDADFKKRGLIDELSTLNFKMLAVLEMEDHMLIQEVKRRGLIDG